MGNPGRRVPQRSKAKTKKRWRVPKALRVSVLLLVATLAILSIYVDSKVRARLAIGTSSGSSGIFAEPFTLRKDNASQLENALRERAYIQVQGEPEAPGQFSASHDGVTIFVRSFYNLNGARVLESKLHFPKDAPITLEPLLLTPLSGQEQRVATHVPLEKIPESLKAAFLSIEDRRFYQHFGIDLFGIGRAIYENVMAGGIVQGGSTLTQQLAKNLFFSSQRTIVRKILEAIAALSLEMRLSKNEILEMYLNEVYFGQFGTIAIHGVGEAAQAFFGKDVGDLTLSESAALAGLVKAPSFYSPIRHPSRAKERRNTVIQALEEEGAIGEESAIAAISAPLKVSDAAKYTRRAPHFVDSLRKHLSKDLSLDSVLATSSLSVMTSINSTMQECGEAALRDGIADLEKKFPRLRSERGKPLEGSLVAIEPFSGFVKTWVGGRDYGKNQFDHVANAERQIGSTIKAFLYLTALDPALNDYKPATPISILTDAPMSVTLTSKKEWHPENYDHEYRGDVTLRYALENSLNIPAAYVAQRVGVNNFAEVLTAFGVSENPPRVPSLALGAVDTTLLRLTSAYGGLANGGIVVAPRLFGSAISSDGERLSATYLIEKRAASEDPVYVLTNILQGVVERGTARGVRNLGYTGPVAGKTGTSDEARDAWFIGYSPTLSVGVWLGFDDNRRVGLTGGSAAVPIWTNFMKCIAPVEKRADFLPPPGVTFMDIDRSTGEPAGEETPLSYITKEVFVRGTEPRAIYPGRQKRQEEGFFEGLFGL